METLREPAAPDRCFLLADLRRGRPGSRHLLTRGLQDGGTDSQPGVGKHPDHLWHHHHLRVLSGVPRSYDGEPLPPPDGTARCIHSDSQTHSYNVAQLHAKLSHNSH